MISERIYLKEGNDNVWLDTYVPDGVEGFTRKAILVIPGGGYGAVCSEREGEPIALAFLPYGYCAFVLHYSVGNGAKYPDQLIEASLAMKHIRENADKYNIDKENVFAVGFSAGGHLAGSLATFWHRPEISEVVQGGVNKPTGAMLIYPVVSGNPEIYHGGSFKNLWNCEQPTDEQLEYASLEKHIDQNTAPMFIMHTSNDQLVDVRNSLRLGEALKAAGHTFEMHIYPKAPHGVALGNEITALGRDYHINTAIAKWVKQAAFWADQLSK